MSLRYSVSMISAGFTLALALLLILAGATLREWSSIDRRLFWVEHTLQVIRSLDRLELGLRDAGAAGREYLSEPLPVHLQKFERGVSDFRGAARELEQLTADNRQQQAQTREAVSLINRKIAVWRVLLTQRLAQPPGDRWLAGAMKVMTISDLLDSIMELRATERELLARRIEASADSIHSGRRLVAIGFLLCLVLLGISLALVLRQMRQRLEAEASLRTLNTELEHRIADRTRDLALSNEELRQEVQAHSRARDEIRQLNASLEQRVAERTAQLEQANKELESFSYSVSHDLRTPLRAIVGFSRMLTDRMGERLQAEDQRLLGVIVDNAARMSTLIDDLLNFSRLGRTPLSLRQVDMHSLATEALQQLRDGGAIGPTARIEVGELPACLGDRNLLLQVWANLLGNAVKFSARVEAPLIQISGYLDNGRVHYQVRDNGTGFDMRYYDKLFGVFQRLHAADEFPGTGVGLANVARIISRHNGRVWAESQLGRGAVFHFELPARGGE